MELTGAHAVTCQCFIEVPYVTAQQQPVRLLERIVLSIISEKVLLASPVFTYTFILYLNNYKQLDPISSPWASSNSIAKDAQAC